MPDPTAATGMDARRQNFDITSRVREFVFGIQDGMLTVLGLVTGIGGATVVAANATAIEANKTLLVAAFIEALSGMVSMGVGEYIGSKAQRDVYKAEIDKERQEMVDNPWEEREEVRILFEEEGLSSADAAIVADKIATSEKSWLKTMVEKELHLTYEEGEQSLTGPLIIGLSYVVGAIFPISPYLLFPASTAIFFSIALTLLGMFTVGAAKARLSDQNMIWSGLQIALIAAATALFAFFIGQGVHALFNA